MGIYILNISADTPDPESNHIAEDLSINDQESMIEVLVETILGFEDTFEEFDDPDGDDQNKKISPKTDLIHTDAVEQSRLYNFSISSKIQFSDPRIKLSFGFSELDSPPPNC
ncbi:hypothetical protein LZF95_08940 [Algoriphagus sp. AGSA1]|uniref:hypothetical protein n=1 Tax=Algoriphagus sp. AGSA1 TaxID=2907213 RepID=UPI001F17F428|nr:hypothetical protein [Algoriphagus sp. AGSA1]MCE7054797.1 hypothetical protein [Algoriphagus sp. AGSA1]